MDRIVYLSPDSCTPLDDIDQEKIYVIGGLVDEGIKKVNTASEHMMKTMEDKISGSLMVVYLV